MRYGLQDQIFVQILHYGKFYRVVVSNISSTKNEINFYNSFFYGEKKYHVKMQIWNMNKCVNEELSVNIGAYQQQ